MNKKVAHLLGHHITTTARSMHRTLQQNFREAGFPITSEQWIVLVWLYDQDGKTQQELCDLTHKDKPGMTRILGNLEKTRLIIRTDDQNDGRTKRVFLTKQSKEMEQQLINIAGATQTKLINGISAAEIEACYNVLNKIQKNSK